MATISKVKQYDRIYTGDVEKIIDLEGTGFNTANPSDYQFAFQHQCKFNEKLGCYEWVDNPYVRGSLQSKTDTETISVYVTVDVKNKDTGCHRVAMTFQGDPAENTGKDDQWIRLDVALNYKCEPSLCDGDHGCPQGSRRREDRESAQGKPEGAGKRKKGAKGKTEEPGGRAA
jgi:hypothetical protein